MDCAKLGCPRADEPVDGLDPAVLKEQEGRPTRLGVAEHFDQRSRGFVADGPALIGRRFLPTWLKQRRITEHQGSFKQSVLHRNRRFLGQDVSPLPYSVNTGRWIPENYLLKHSLREAGVAMAFRGSLQLAAPGWRDRAVDDKAAGGEPAPANRALDDGVRHEESEPFLRRTIRETGARALDAGSVGREGPLQLTGNFQHTLLWPCPSKVLFLRQQFRLKHKELVGGWMAHNRGNSPVDRRDVLCGGTFEKVLSPSQMEGRRRASGSALPRADERGAAWFTGTRFVFDAEGHT